MKKIRIIMACLFSMSLLLTVSACGKKDIVTIVQYLTHEALGSATEGIIKGLEEKGYVNGDNINIKIVNPEAKADLLSTMAATAIEESIAVFCVATPAAKVVINESKKQGSNIPIFFTAVTDPVVSQLIDNATLPGGNVTGTSDMNPVAEQIALAKEINSNIKKIGMIYTTEENSLVQAELAEKAAADLGVELIQQVFSTLADLPIATNTLVNANVDAIYLPTDNIVAENMNVIANITNLAGIPTICGESGMVAKGGSITIGIDYYLLGIQTGHMAAKVLSGEKNPGEIAVEVQSKYVLVINKKECLANGIIIPESLYAKADTILE